MLTCKVVTVATTTHKMQHQHTNGVTDEPFKNVPSKNMHVLGFNTLVQVASLPYRLSHKW